MNDTGWGIFSGTRSPFRALVSYTIIVKFLKSSFVTSAGSCERLNSVGPRNAVTIVTNKATYSGVWTGANAPKKKNAQKLA